jgi:hypothetical protein
LLKGYDLSLNVSALCLTERSSACRKNGFVRLMGEKFGSKTSFLCKIGLETLGSKIIILEIVSRTVVLMGCRHHRETGHSFGRVDLS